MSFSIWIDRKSGAFMDGLPGATMMNGEMSTNPMSRREMLSRAGAGFGSVALSALLADPVIGGETLAPRVPHRPARARRAIFLFMPGGPSQVDTFDPKPRLSRDNGMPSPKSYLGQTRKLLASPWRFSEQGE